MDHSPLRRTRALVIRSLGAVTAIAFASLWVQVHGLIGSRGVLPVPRFLDRVAHEADGNPFWDVPTLFWWWPTDSALTAVCGIGVALSLSVLAGFPVEGPLLLALWASYLSISQVGQVFLGFQWDTLLTETLALSLLIARWTPGAAPEPSPVGMWAIRLLLFKLMLGSGLVKLASGDPTWWDGSALAFHYWTQPLPNPLSWWFDRAPLLWHRIETWATLFIEIVLPFVIFTGRRGRIAAAWGFAIVLGVLMISGNYGFFQLLSLVLVASLLDDQALPGATGGSEPAFDERLRGPREIAIGLVLASWVTLSVPLQVGRTFGWDHLPNSVVPVLEQVWPWRTVNAYGLFARMTTTRPEVTIEGSDDGQTWTPYVFRYKPGPLERRPAQIAPHMPRLDWQMWFAALSSCERTPWMPALMDRLQAREPAVLALIANDPFPNGPRYVRATRSLYRFSERGGWTIDAGPERYCEIRLSVRPESDRVER